MRVRMRTRAGTNARAIKIESQIMLMMRAIEIRMVF